MYDDDLFNMLNSYTATETEQNTSTDTEIPSYNPYQSNPYIDDYSTNQNFEEETSYNSTRQDSEFSEEQVQSFRQMDTPKILQSKPAVSLIKKREKIYLSGRLKTAAVVFAIIFAAIIFATVWNFALVSKMQASFAGKEFEISQMTQSINELSVEYNELTSPGYGSGEFNGYVEKVDGVNSFTISLDEFYTEPEVEKLPSNWFNDVCEIFSNLFA